MLFLNTLDIVLRNCDAMIFSILQVILIVLNMCMIGIILNPICPQEKSLLFLLNTFDLSDVWQSFNKDQDNKHGLTPMIILSLWLDLIGFIHIDIT